MRKLLLFGGTTEGREFAEKLAQLPVEVTVSVATEYGREMLAEAKCTKVLSGRMSQEEMTRELQKGYSWVVDATHPYAVEVSRHIRMAANETGTKLFRLSRRASVFDGCRMAETPAQAAEMLRNTQGNILLTTGSKELAAFDCLPRERLFVRVLPSRESIALCEERNIPHSHILALQGPFTKRLNEAILEQYHIAVLVTKDGGDAGGFPEKVAGAKAMGAEIFVIGRPPQEAGESEEEILRQIKMEGEGHS